MRLYNLTYDFLLFEERLGLPYPADFEVFNANVKYYGEQKALDDVSFDISTGEIVGFLGPNGAGKSTLMKIITGYIPPSSGRILVNGMDVSSDDPSIRSKTGYLPENNPLYPEMYVREYLSFVASVYKMTGGEKKEAVEKIIAATGLIPESKKKIGSLSKGFRQRVGLAQALIHNPEILILDEATSGLDPNQIVEIRSLIREAGKEKTVLLSTHIMQEVEAICDRIIIIDKGKIVADEPRIRIYDRIRKPFQVIEVEFDINPDAELLKGIANVISARNTGANSWLIEAEGNADIRPLIFSFAVKNKFTVLSLSKKETNLEEVFRSLTSD